MTLEEGRAYFEFPDMASKRPSSGSSPQEGKKSKVNATKEPKDISGSAVVKKQPPIHVANRCWARTRSGQLCGVACSRDDNIPYCPTHFSRGDDAVKVVDHDEKPEIFGKILIATQDLPKGYKFVYWGDLLRRSEIQRSAHDHMIEFTPNPYKMQVRGTIDPTTHPISSVMQYAMMPGPIEVINMAPTWQHFGRCGKHRTALAARVYKLTRDVPKGQQISHDYGKDWMEARGIEKLNCGTKKYPMPRRATLAKKQPQQQPLQQHQTKEKRSILQKFKSAMTHRTGSNAKQAIDLV